MKKIVIGICGYIGSGKTAAGMYFKRKGMEFIQSDNVVDELYKIDGQGYKKIKNFFGELFFYKNGALNRRKLAKFVFSDVNKLKILNGLIHPLVTNKIQQLIDSSKYEIIFIEAVYFEPKYLLRLVQKVIWIGCDRNTLLKRAKKRADMTFKEAKNILDLQTRIGIKPSKIDYKVDNSGPMKKIENQLDKILKDISKS